MEELELILTNQIPSGVYRLESQASVQALEALIEAHGWCFLYLDGTHIFKVEQFYVEFGLKSKSGANANQLWDIFQDLEMWFSKCQQNVRGYIVLYDQFENWYQNNPKPSDLYGIGGTIDLIKEALVEERVIGEDERYRKGAVGKFGQFFLLRGDSEATKKLNIFPIKSSPS